MRVVVLSKAFVRGAYQRKAEEIASLGVDLTVLVPPRWTEAGHTTQMDRAFTRGYQLVELPLALDGHFHLHFYPTLARWIDRLRPDVFHVDEEPYNLATFHAYAVGRRAGTRLVFFTWQNLLRRYPIPFRWMEWWVLSRSNGAIAGNEDARTVLRTKGYRGPIAVVPQVGFDPEVFVPADQRPDRPFTIGYLGRLEAQKGLLDLLEACASLRGDWRLKLVGYGPLAERLSSRAAALGIAERLEMVPPVASTEVVPIYHSFDAVALPSRSTPRWIEQFGRILVEAMACGVPTIGSDSGEVPNVIGDAGLVFPEGNISALRDNLQRLLDDAGLYRDLVRRGRERFLTTYTQAQVARATVDLYRQALVG